MLLAQVLSAAALAAVHLWAQGIRSLTRPLRTRLLSAGGGVAAAYVFLRLLPEMYDLQQEVSATATGLLGRVDHHIYIFALAGLLVFYVLERSTTLAGGPDRRTGGSRWSELASWVTWATYGSYVTFSILVGYLIAERTGLDSYLVFVVAFGIHFYMMDQWLRDHHEASYLTVGRWLCSAAVVVGLVLGWLVELPVVAMAGIVGLLAGGLIMSSMRDEIPDERDSRPAWFVLAAVTYALLLTFL